MKRLIDSYFKLTENGTALRIELVAGLTTFLTMAYIIFVQPAVLSGVMFGMDTGMDVGAVTTATCYAAALSTAIMALYARYPIAQAPGMGENFFFVFQVLPAAGALAVVKSGEAAAWEVGLGVVFISGMLFLVLSLFGVRALIVDAISPSMKNGIAVGIGIFIAFIGLQNAGLIVKDPGSGVAMNPHFLSPDIIIFMVGLLFTAAMHARRVRGAIFWGILLSTVLSVILKIVLPRMPELIGDASLVQKAMLTTRFKIAHSLVSSPPSLSPTFFKMNVVQALSIHMIPFIIILLFMDVFDTIGTLIGVSEQAGFIKDNKLPRINRALVSDAVGTVAGACMGTSTVTSFIESATGVEHGGRTGLTSLTTAVLFLLALFFSPLIEMVGSYGPITAPALVIVGAMMIQNVRKIDWRDQSETVPAFLIMIGIPLSYSIGDGLAFGFISYPFIKFFSGKGREVNVVMYGLAIVLLAYFVAVRSFQ
ncbi:MAG: NCS2 family permease [Spartobacteria bacterium]|nr:NCS2 family permease [Spartobacteria bacterium]